MPELPEVETMVRGVRSEIEGRRIVQTEFCRCSCRPITLSPSRPTFRRRTQDATIQAVSRLAKRVVIELTGGQAIVIEPRMTGLVLVAAPPTRNHRRICWHLEPKADRPSAFEFWDRRGLGTVKLLNADEMVSLREKLGPDALQMSADQWYEGLRKTRRAVKVAMLDQSLVAGIGNLYASEILHRANVSPLRAGIQVNRQQCQRIAAATSEVLLEAIRYEGSTLNDGTYRNALNQNGSYQNEHRVYQKADTACRGCGRGTIQRIVQAQRSTFFCPACQK